jgi:hypothetical protein
MALPEIAAFEEFLGHTSVLSERPDAAPSEVIQSSTESVHGPGVTLWLEYPATALQLDSVLKKVGEGLATAGAPSSRSVALAMLALIVVTKGAGSHVEHANRLFREVRQGDLWFNFVSPGPAPTAGIRADYGPVKVEPFDPTKLEYWAGRSGAQWPIAPTDLRGRVAFVGRVQGVTLINTDRLPGGERLFTEQVDAAKVLGLVDAYYQSVADVLLDQLRADTAQRLSLVEAAGIAAFDLSSLMKWTLGIHLFTWRRSRVSGAGSWAIFRQPGLVLNTPPAEIWQDAREWLLKEFGLYSLSGRDRPIDVAAQTFAGLMQAARAHVADGRLREAFLYFVIALDHLLGEDGRNVSTVADRTGVLTHRIRSNTFADEVARVRRIYDVRSRLVHTGSPVTGEDLCEADAIASGVLWAMTRVVADGELESRDDWVERIDSLAHLFRGDPDVVTMDRLAAVGVLSNFEAGPPPPMLRDRGGLWRD